MAASGVVPAFPAAPYQSTSYDRFFFYSLSSLSRSLDCTLMSNSIFIAHVMLMADESADCDADDKDGRKNLCIRKSRWRIEVVP